MRFISVLLMSISLWQIQGQEATTYSLINNYKIASSLSYDLDYRIKTFDSEEWYEIKTAVVLVRLPQDSIFGGAFYYAQNGLGIENLKELENKIVEISNKN